MRIDDKLHEECAVFAVSTHSTEAAGITYNGLLSMQHRGQEGSGIAVLSDHTLHCYKDVGLVSEVFQGNPGPAPSRLAVGHNRYSPPVTTRWKTSSPFIT